MSERVVIAAVGVGSNLGDRGAMLALARGSLERADGVRSVRCSSAHETPALTLPGAAPQPDYLNAAAAVETTLGARALLGLLLSIEREAGRDRAGEPRWGARVLDLDLLLYGEAEIDEPGLSVPHPRMHDRAFVLAPLAEVLPDAVVPGSGGATVSGLLSRLRGGTIPS